MGKYTLLDVGGTFVKCQDGRQVPIRSNGSKEEICAALKESVGTVNDGDRIGVAIPGPFDYENGIFLMEHKFASVYGENFKDICGAGNKGDFRYVHDIVAMLLGEMVAGKGKEYNRVAMVSLGTGLGFCMSIDGEILKNEKGSPAVSIFKRPYRDGILEDYASKRGFHRGFEGLSVKDLADLAKAGDEKAIERFNDTGYAIGSSIGEILNEYKIECLLFGGQISRSFFLMEKSLKEGLGEIPTLKYAGPISDFDNATFNGLKHLFK